MPYPPSDFRAAPSPYASKPGDPAQLYPIDLPDHYETGDDDLGLARGIGHGLIITGLGLLAVYLVVQWVVAP